MEGQNVFAVTLWGGRCVSTHACIIFIYTLIYVSGSVCPIGPNCACLCLFSPCVWLLVILNNILHGCSLNHLWIAYHLPNACNLHGSPSGWVHVLVNMQMWVSGSGWCTCVFEMGKYFSIAQWCIFKRVKAGAVFSALYVQRNKRGDQMWRKSKDMEIQLAWRWRKMRWIYPHSWAHIALRWHH